MRQKDPHKSSGEKAAREHDVEIDTWTPISINSVLILVLSFWSSDLVSESAWAMTGMILTFGTNHKIKLKFCKNIDNKFLQIYKPLACF